MTTRLNDNVERMCLKAEADECILTERQLNAVTCSSDMNTLPCSGSVVHSARFTPSTGNAEPGITSSINPHWLRSRWRQIFRRNESREIDLIDARAPGDGFWYIPGEHTWLHIPRIPFNWLTLLINRFDEVHDQNCAFYLPSHRRRRAICNTKKKALKLCRSINHYSSLINYWKR